MHTFLPESHRITIFLADLARQPFFQESARILQDIQLLLAREEFVLWAFECEDSSNELFNNWLKILIIFSKWVNFQINLKYFKTKLKRCSHLSVWNIFLKKQTRTNTDIISGMSLEALVPKYRSHQNIEAVLHANQKWENTNTVHWSADCATNSPSINWIWVLT